MVAKGNVRRPLAQLQPESGKTGAGLGVGVGMEGCACAELRRGARPEAKVRTQILARLSSPFPYSHFNQTSRLILLRQKTLYGPWLFNWNEYIVYYFRVKVIMQIMQNIMSKHSNYCCFKSF